MGYKHITHLLKQNRKLLYYVAVSFFILVVIGYIQPNYFLGLQEQTINEILAQIEGKNVFEVTAFIILNNIKTAFFSILFGILFLPIFALVINGYFVGAVLHNAIEKTSPLIVWRLLPHGILELPAIFLAFTFGLRIGLNLFKKDRKKEVIKAYREAFAVFMRLIIPLLIAAGMIEGALFHIFS